MLRPITNRASIRANLSSPWRGPQNGAIRAPAVLLKAGTFTGSHGPTRYTRDLLRRTASEWNNKPVTWRHPTDEIGPISAQHAPDDIVGYVDNVTFDGDALRGEIVVTDERFRSQAQSITEVSTGLFVDTDEAGNALDVTPDHLALLPDERGACSWADGCGVRANEAPLRNLVAESLRGHVNAMGVDEMSKRRYDDENVLLPPDVEVNDQEALTEAALDRIEQNNGVLMPTGLRAQARDEARRRAAERGEDEPARSSDDDEEILLPIGMN